MPREVKAKVETSDEEDEVQRDILNGGESDAMEERGPADTDEATAEPADGGEEAGQDEEVYEIEVIIHHKSGMFNKGKTMGYYVKWKGYPESENSWVSADDCNAPELIEEYFNKMALKRKPKGKGKRAREEDTVMQDATKTKKSKTLKSSTTERKPNGRTSLRELDEEDEEQIIGPVKEPQIEYGTMEEYMEEDDWEGIIDELLTVDYSADESRSVVYFLRLKNGENKATTGEWMIKKAPNMTIRFYEENLKFKQTSSNTDD